MLQAIAMLAALATILLSLGFATLQVSAANLTTVSDTLSDSSPNASSTHTIVFTSPTGIVNGEYATVTMPTGFTGIAALTASDITLSTTTAATIAGTCGASDIAFTTSGQNLVFEFCSAGNASLSAGGTTTITIGAGATTKITNPASPLNGNQSYEINIAAGASDTGATRVVILDSITVTASVDTIFTFAVGGLGAGENMNGTTTTGSTGSTTIPFGTLSAGVATRTAQLLTVNTNAANGYSVTVQIDGPLESSTGADIDSFANGADNDTPAGWSAPSGTLGSEKTYGHWGVTSDDTAAGRGAEFASEQFVGVSTTPKIVMGHTGPANGAGTGVGTTTVGYEIQISALQEAGDDYTAQLTYIATPTF
jgi:hypothetical protein